MRSPWYGVKNQARFPRHILMLLVDLVVQPDATPHADAARHRGTQFFCEGARLVERKVRAVPAMPETVDDEHVEAREAAQERHRRCRHLVYLGEVRDELAPMHNHVAPVDVVAAVHQRHRVELQVGVGAQRREALECALYLPCQRCNAACHVLLLILIVWYQVREHLAAHGVGLLVEEHRGGAGVMPLDIAHVDQSVHRVGVTVCQHDGVDAADTKRREVP